MRPSATILFSVMISLPFLAACEAPPTDEGAEAGVDTAGVQIEHFGEVDGEPIQLYTLTNANGMQVRATNYGGIITHLFVPDAEGNLEDVVLGYDSVDGYLDESPYFGAIIGRYGNRIADGEFSLDGETYTLATNNGPNHLHGGERGFDKVVWDATTFDEGNERGISFTYTSPAGEEGYPGTLNARVTYTLNDNDELIFDYYATTDEATPVNLTQHTYFNLAGVGEGDILDHRIMINADAYTPVDSTLIPTGDLATVDGTPFDFTEATPIGARIEEDDQQLDYGLGYDHNFVLNGQAGEMKLAARVTEPTSGRIMTVRTTEPGLQFYTGNFLDGSLTGKDVAYDHRTGFCLETQHFPNSPNQGDFPSTILRPGEEYTTRTVYAFEAGAEVDPSGP